jgi:hypothetical protein
MKFMTLTGTFDSTAARDGNRQGWMCVMTLSLVVSGAVLMQGCAAGAWLAAMAVDTMKSSHITFWPFEQSWVAPRDRSSDAMRNPTVTSIAVLPVEGDPEMSARLATMLQQETTLRVESPSTVEAGATKTDSRSAQADEKDRSTLAKEVTRDMGVDTVLIGRVTGSPSHPSDWGWKAEGSRRLYLYLVNHDGRLLWKDQLPFTLVKGVTPPVEASVQVDLAHHVMQQVKKLRLDELGYLPKKLS